MFTLKIDPERCETKVIKTKNGTITSREFTAVDKIIYCPLLSDAFRLAWDMVKDN